jgi:2',3'-cyclic-nucleotide 2'-phosphodiesterase (5'-nucleotidase family)
VSIRDLALGVDFLRGLRKQAEFPFLATNLVVGGKPLFETYREFTYGDISVLVMSVLTPAPGLVQGVEIQAPADAIRAVLRGLPAKERFVIVLADLSWEERVRLAKEVPEVRVLLGGVDKTDRGEQISPTVLVYNGSDKLREVGSAAITLKAGFRENHFKPFFQFEAAQAAQESIEQWQAQARELERAADRTKKRADREKKRGEARALYAKITEQEAVFGIGSPDAIRYEFETTVVDEKLAGENPVSALVRAYQNQVSSPNRNNADLAH